MTSDTRYNGKPLLRLLELYVLRAISELSPADEEKLNAMAPKLHELYGGDGAWHEAIAASLDLPPDMPEMIQGLWVRNQEIARAEQTTLAPQQFAAMFVDANFTV